MPFCIVLTQDTKGNVIDAMYDDPDKKDKLMIATKKQFEIVGDVNLLIEDNASHDLQATACNSNMPHFQSSQEVVKNQSNEQMVDEFVDQFFLTQNWGHRFATLRLFYYKSSEKHKTTRSMFYWFIFWNWHKYYDF